MPRSLTTALLTFLGASAIAFGIMHLAPGDPARFMLGFRPGIRDDQVRALRELYGLDDPIPLQYARWMARVVRGDLGTSLVGRRSIGPEVAQKAPWTLALLTTSGVLAAAIALSVASARARGGAAGRAADAAAALGAVMPAFMVATLLFHTFAVRLTWVSVLPPFEMNPLALSFWRGLLLPSVSLALPIASAAALQMREDLRSGTALAPLAGAGPTGTAAGRWTVRAVLRSARGSVLRQPLPLVGLWLSGLIVIEEIYNWPGLGRMFVRAMSQRDIPVVQAGLLLFAALAVAVEAAASAAARRASAAPFAQAGAPGGGREWGRGSPVAPPGLRPRIALAVVVTLAIASAAAPLIARFPADQVLLDEIHSPPSLRHWMGTDSSGRDLLSRLLRATWASAGIALGAAAAAVLGALALCGLRLVAAVRPGPGWLAVASLVPRSAAAVPPLGLALAVVVTAGRAPAVMIAVFAAAGAALLVRRLASLLVEARGWTFVQAARAAGASPAWIVERHMAPHLVRPLLAAAAGLVPAFLALEATLGFLGFSLSPTTPTWGTLLWRSREALYRGDWWLLVFPALFLASAMWAFAALAAFLAEPPPPTYVKRVKRAKAIEWKQVEDGRRWPSGVPARMRQADALAQRGHGAETARGPAGGGSG